MVIDVRSREYKVFRQGYRELKMDPMFDIYTSQGDGTLTLVESVDCQTRAQDTALRLSVLFPGESFAYFERTEAFFDPAVIGNGRGGQQPFPGSPAGLRLPC